MRDPEKDLRRNIPGVVVVLRSLLKAAQLATIMSELIRNWIMLSVVLNKTE